ncbi:hypothetical protein TIFTF001_032122 [Ficus carica]|uniref:Uncharacterized protein n=1 Tax=Ficus carica TaxID=3494 RepID=A0AA88E2R2_FICCA|nr:hypothetical protein TIFTF001_032122 [Ficus carica]
MLLLLQGLDQSLLFVVLRREHGVTAIVTVVFILGVDGDADLAAGAGGGGRGGGWSSGGGGGGGVMWVAGRGRVVDFEGGELGIGGIER